MAKSKRKRVPKTVLKLQDLEQSKSAVLNSLTSSSSKRSYDHAIREFIDWYCSEPRLAFNRTVVTRVSFALDLDVSFDGSALGVVQPDFIWPSFVIADFTEEGPVTIPAPVKVFRFEPARAFVWVPSSCPLPQTREDVEIHVSKRVFAHHVPMIVRPTANFRVDQSNRRQT